MNFNRIILGGHLTRNVEVQALPSGVKLAKFGLATNESWKNEAGQKCERVCFVDCIHWGNGADVLAKYVHKGSPLLIEGTLQLEQWTKDGATHSKHVVKVENFTLCGGKEGAK